ncbi:hypothetical protein [Zavarzinia compransoris]|uniref:Uncharacterized protein n=1 Tax=Zavarzinia compransoris TaxID=1264899 RepID=A0A317E5P5_9PROT|nr:hypothetical protein [Zavarzinia compransoris]PWR20673.1 hypothetical protein DKG75_11775 [Zavarzinia compransoris]TDP44505.1 hypothetical protein DES42_107273 [Zavarzinia compransoris]
MDYWSLLARQRSNEAKARALSPILRRAGGGRATPVLADAGRTIAALRQENARQQAEIDVLRGEIADLRGRPS